MRRDRKQPDLFPGAAIGQRRYVTPEPTEIYSAVVKLRAANCDVYRAGKLHKVNGCLRTDRELKMLAANLNRKKSPDSESSSIGLRS